MYAFNHYRNIDHLLTALLDLQARFLEQTDDTEVITFMDNGGDGPYMTSDYSSSLVVLLDKRAMVANVTKRWIRPDREVTTARGNFQLLPNGNAFTGWSENCKISEHSWDGELLMEAEFAGHRFVTYRTWKSNFTGMPSDPPDLRAFVYGLDARTSITVVYVSWNGATEVVRWDFYCVVDKEILLGSKNKTGFETTFQIVGYKEKVLAEAVGADGSPMGRSMVHLTTVHEDWIERSTQRVYSTHEVMLNEIESEHTRQEDGRLITGQVKLAYPSHHEVAYVDTQGKLGGMPNEKTEL